MNIVKQIVKAAQEDLKIKNANTINGINKLLINMFFFKTYCFTVY